VPGAGDPGAFGDEVAASRRELGHLLARLRHGAGLSQRQLARAVSYSAAVVALAERGRPAAAEGFWVSADRVLGAAGELSAGYHRLRDMQHAAHESERSRQIAAQLERIDRRAPGDPRGTDAHAGNGASGRVAAATAVGTCPNCRQPVMLTTLLTAPGEPTSEAVSHHGQERRIENHA
jgi:transcriptional regulator with XRE-family HTH domain